MDAADEIAVVVAGSQVTDDDAIALGRGGVDVLTVADVDTGVRACFAGIAAGIVEEHQITGLQFADAVDLGADAALPLAGSGVRQGITVLLVNIHGIAGAVKAACGSAAPDIGGAKIGQSELSRLGADRRTFRGKLFYIVPMHVAGGVAKADLNNENLDALKKGIAKEEKM